jgi:hypothetical protein
MDPISALRESRAEVIPKKTKQPKDKQDNDNGPHDESPP